jgi:hypothetical protein
MTCSMHQKSNPRKMFWAENLGLDWNNEYKRILYKKCGVVSTVLIWCWT